MPIVHNGTRKLNELKVQELDKMELVMLISDMYQQACSYKGGYGHGFIGCYEEAEELLMDLGILEVVT